LKHPDNVDGPLAFVRFYRLWWQEVQSKSNSSHADR
jgi:hypothetical protein